MEIVNYLPMELRLHIYRMFVPLMTINKHLKTELERKWLCMVICVQDIDLLKSRSRLFRNCLHEHDIAEDTWINADYHVDYVKNELPVIFKRTSIANCNRLLIKDLGDCTKTVYDFKHGYALSHLIVSFNYYGCDQLQEQLVNFIATETPERPLKSIMKYLVELSENSDSIKTFVEQVTMKLK